MKSEIAKSVNDNCLLGFGANGLLLAAHVKRLSKKALHLGGLHSCYLVLKAAVGMN